MGRWNCIQTLMPYNTFANLCQMALHCNSAIWFIWMSDVGRFDDAPKHLSWTQNNNSFVAMQFRWNYTHWPEEPFIKFYCLVWSIQSVIIIVNTSMVTSAHKSISIDQLQCQKPSYVWVGSASVCVGLANLFAFWHFVGKTERNIHEWSLNLKFWSKTISIGKCTHKILEHAYLKFLRISAFSAFSARVPHFH